MQFSIGERVYNRVTGEAGTIVRILDARTYIVEIAAGAGASARESMWLKSDITRKPETLPPGLRKA